MPGKLKCTCGTCNVCKSRARMKRLYDAKKLQRQAKTEHPTPTAPNKKAPSPNKTKPLPNKGVNPELPGGQVPRGVNLALWIHGGARDNWNGLEHIIYNMSRDYAGQIRDLRTRINQHHIKTIKGQDYIYSKWNGETKYHGKHDPRPELETQIIKLEDELKARTELMKSCVLGRIKDHLVVDIEKMRMHVKGGKADVVTLQEVRECSSSIKSGT